MDHIAHAAINALFIIGTPSRLLLLVLGVMLGLVISLIPGLGGIVGLALLLPFTFDLDPYSAMAIMMGLAAAVSHGDVIPAILFGVPGTVGCAATVMDGYPMAKKGQAGRALGAAFNASLVGGLFGAAILALAIPVIQPVILLFGAPQMLAISVFGLTLVSSLSGNAPLKGATAALLGLSLSMIGGDVNTGTLRFTFGSLYLWEGLPLVPFALGIFAIPELCDMMIARVSVARGGRVDALQGQWRGCRDVFEHWFLVLRSSTIGSLCAMIPGIGATVIDWIAYSHAARTEKGARETFGTGDVRGVIASESSTNAREGGALVPTIAFGVPSSPSMAILLSAFLIHGIVPGPDMLAKHLDLTYTIVWSLALANVLGTVICFLFANQFARISTIRYTILLPLVLALVFIGSFEGQHSWGDIVSLLLFGAVGWMMKRTGWPRPPIILGFILGPLIARYASISMDRYGWEWLSNWFVIGMFALSVLGLVRQFLARAADRRPVGISWRAQPRFSPAALFAAVAFVVFAGSLPLEWGWPLSARIIPQTFSIAGVVLAAIVLASQLFVRKDEGAPDVLAGDRTRVMMDLQSDFGNLTDRVVLQRFAIFLGWSVALGLIAYVIGFIPALAVFLVLFMRFQGRESWRVTLGVSATACVLLYVIFNVVVHEAWPVPIFTAAWPKAG